MKQVSIYNGVKDTDGYIVSFEYVKQRILTGAKGLDKTTELLNVLYQTDREAYDREKLKLPAVTWAGTFPKGKRTAEHLLQHSGYIVLDIDNDIDIGTVLADFAQHSHIAFAFVSPSGTGVKPVIPIDPIPQNAAEHRAAFQAVLEVFSEYAEQDPEKLPKQRDPNRLCFLAHDSRAISNPHVTPVTFDPSTAEIETLTERSSPATPIEIDISVEAYIKQHGIHFDASGNSQYFPKSHCPITQHKSNNNAVRYFQNDDGSINGFCNGCKGHWYLQRPRHRNHKPVKLQKSDVALLTEPIEKAREAIRSAFDQDEKLIGFRADTGIGKTHETITLYQLKGIGGFFSTPTSDLAKEVETRLDDAECDVFRWRGLHAEPDGQFPHEKPCMFPDEYTAYATSGRNAYKMLCEQCQFLTECEADGYRSQEAKAKAAQVTVAAHKDILMNPIFRSTAKRLLPTHQDDLIVIDEFNVFEAFIEIEVTQARLEYLRDTWHDHPLGDFAMDLLHACVVQNAPHTGITEIINIMSGIDQQAIREALASYSVGDKIYTRKEAHQIAADIGQSVEHIEALPKIETEDWNLLIQLELFIEVFRHAAGAPIQWHDNALTFYLPPLPLYTDAKVLCMSATLNQHFFEKVFTVRQQKRGDVGFIDADDTDWHPDARVYQLRTNRNPRGTLLDSEKDVTGKWHYTGLSNTGQQAYNAILESAKANPDRQHALISYMHITETHADELKQANIITGHYGNLVGLDQHFGRDTDDGIVLHILGAPEVPPHETEHRCQLLYGDRETPPDFTRDETTGAYHDRDVQAVYEAGVKSEIMQAIGRAGLVKNPSTVVLWTSHELPSVSHREQTQHFDETDWATAEGHFDELPVTIEAREAREQAEAEAIASGDVRSVMETTGQSERTARSKTKAVRDQLKADRDAEIIRLHQQDLSLRKITDATGYKFSTVSRVVKAYQNGKRSIYFLYRGLPKWYTHREHR